MLKNILIFFCVSIAFNQIKNGLAVESICNVTTTNVTLPDLPDQYQAFIELNVRSSFSNHTEEYQEYYDLINNRGTVVRFANFRETKEYYLYDTLEFISVYDSACLVSNLTDKTGDLLSFGVDIQNGTGRIRPPSYLIKLGLNLPTEYVGTDVIRGINVRKWQSCIFLPEDNITQLVTWSFSDPETWTTTISFQNLSFPIEIKIVEQFDNGEILELNYQYTSFRPAVVAGPEIFETPKGVYCEGRKPTRPVPKVPSHFSYRIEANLVDLNQTTTQAEWYDFDNKLARIDYQPLAQEDIDVLGTDRITEIHDFNSGTRYIINQKKEKCINVTMLDPYSVDTNFANSSRYVRIRTALEMFHFDQVKYQYHGSRKIRDIDCDVWIAKRTDWPPQPGYQMNSTWEWYFMTANWTAYNSGLQEVNIPVQLILTKYIPFGPIFLTTTTIYNYFDFKREQSDVFQFQIQDCFYGIGSRHLMLTFNNVELDSIENKHQFRYSVFSKIANLTYLLPTRIDQVELDFKDGDLFVLFKLIEASSVHGNVENPVSQISLKDAESLLKKAVDNGEFKFQLGDRSFSANKLEVVNKDGNVFSNKLVWISVLSAGVGGILLTLLGVFIIVKLRARKNDSPILSMSGLMNQNFEK